MVHLFFISLILSDLVHTSFDKLAIIVFGILGLYSWLIKRKLKLFAFEAFYLFFVFMMLVTAIKVNFSGNTFQYLFLFILQFGLLSYILDQQLKNKHYIANCFEQIIKWNLFVSLVGIFDFMLYKIGIVSPIRDYFYSFKVDSFYPSPNVYGVISAFCLVFTLRKVELTGYSYTRMITLIIFSISVLLSTSSMALGIPLLYLIIKRLNHFYMVLAVAGVIILISYWELYAGYPDIPVDLILNKRLEIWIHAFQMWLESPYFGIGTGNFQLFNDLQFSGRDIGSSYGLHSIYMWLIIETGIVGTFAFILFFITAVVRIYNYKKKRIIFSFFLLIFICQLTEFYLDHEEVFVLLFWLIVVGACVRTPYFFMAHSRPQKAKRNFISEAKIV